MPPRPRRAARWHRARPQWSALCPAGTRRAARAPASRPRRQPHAPGLLFSVRTWCHLRCRADLPDEGGNPGPVHAGGAAMTTLPTPRPGHEGSEVPSLIAASLRGRRRRPSGEAPPLPRHIDYSIRWYLLLAGVAAALWAGMSVPAVLGAITRGDLAILRAVGTVRTAWLTHVMLDVNAALTSPWAVRLVMLGTFAVLVAFRRFQHLAAY